MKWELISTKTVPTIVIQDDKNKTFLHSKYDPLKETQTWVDHLNINVYAKDIIVIGMGLGYHISYLAKKYKNYQIHVFEFNQRFAQWLIEKKLLKFMDSCNNIKFYFQNDERDLLNKLSALITRAQNNLFIYHPSLRLIENSEIKGMLQSFIIKMNTIKEQSKLLEANFLKNRELKDKDISTFLGNYKNDLVILVSAGPSLTKQLPLLKRAVLNKIHIACVGTALLPLLRAGITPDFIMISDPNDLILEQFENVSNLEVPLFYLSTANHLTVKTYKGPRYIVWQKGHKLAEMQAKITKVPLIETGGSVATCLLDLLVKFGFNKVALVGQDLAFTNYQTHALGTHAFKKVSENFDTITVDGYYLKNKVITSKQLYVYLKWFERYVMDNKHLELWNCTEGGAHIKGWKHQPLSEFLNNVQHL